MTFGEMQKCEEVNAYIRQGDLILETRGFTKHGKEHCLEVAKRASYILDTLHYPRRQVELVQIAGYLHDIGNAVNRKRHAEYGAILARQILQEEGLPLEDCISVMSCIANHDESTGKVFDPMSAALVLADKTDIGRYRVRERKSLEEFDIHDKVNYAVTASRIEIDAEQESVILRLRFDESLCEVLDFYQVYLDRMLMCRQAAMVLGLTFRMQFE